MNATSAQRVPYLLRHAWSSPGDRAALALCAAELSRHGIDFRDAPEGAAANAVKMHGFELVEAVSRGEPALVDLQELSQARSWPSRLDPRVWRFMAHGSRVHGIPVGLHQSNALWADAGTARAVRASSSGALDLLRWLELASGSVAKPLAIGREPWQIGILFESICLATLGASHYERAFVALDPDALGGTGMVKALDLLGRLRAFVDEASLAAPWRDQLARVAEGDAAVIVMGDWVSASLPSSMVRLKIEGFDEETLFIADFFVPVGRARDLVSAQVASALTGPDFQRAFAAAKGCRPVLPDVESAPQAGRVRIDAPSLTFDQCCGQQTQRAILAIVAEHFLAPGSPEKTAAALAAIVRA